MKFKNTSDLPVTVRELGIVADKGAIVDVPDEYARPGKHGNGARKPSIIEMLAPQLVPANKDDELEWRKIPERDNAVPDVTGPPTVEMLVAQGIPRSVAEHTARRRRIEWDADQARKRAEAEMQRADSVEMEAAKVAAAEEDARKRHDDEMKEDDARRSKSAKEGNKRIKEEQDAERKRLEAEKKANSGDKGSRLDEVTLGDIAGQTGTGQHNK